MLSPNPVLLPFQESATIGKIHTVYIYTSLYTCAYVDYIYIYIYTHTHIDDIVERLNVLDSLTDVFLQL